MTKLNVEEFHIRNYKKFSDYKMMLKNQTTISGKNGEGKSTINSILPYLLFNTDEFGNKLDLSPIGDIVNSFVEGMVQINAETFKIARTTLKGVNKGIEVNGLPMKVRDFESFLDEQSIDKDVFLSVYNPTYFFGLHWKKQRELIFNKIERPFESEVLEEMKERHVNVIKDELAKYDSIEKLILVAKNGVKKSDDEIKRLRGRISVLEEQTVNCITFEEKTKLRHKFEELEVFEKLFNESLEKLKEFDYELNGLMKERRLYEIQLSETLESFKKLKENKKTCSSCGNELNLDQRKQKAEVIAKVANRGKESENNLKAIDQKIKRLNEKKELIEKTKQEYYSPSRKEEMFKIQIELSKVTASQNDLQKEKEKLEVEKETHLDFMTIQEAAEKFKTKMNELYVEKINTLFDNLQVSIFEEQKNGDLKESFDIVIGDKKWYHLSTGERIRAGLEVAEVISKLYDFECPTFIDNAESISGKVRTNRQTLLAYVSNDKLVIE